MSAGIARFEELADEWEMRANRARALGLPPDADPIDRNTSITAVIMLEQMAGEVRRTAVRAKADAS